MTASPTRKLPAFALAVRAKVLADPTFEARAAGMYAAMKESDPALVERFDPLRDRLLAAAGIACAPQHEEDLDKLLSRGQFYNAYGARRMPGRPSECHGNTARLWDANRDRVQIVTGYALSPDGCWRQHSWGWLPDGQRVVETTEKRILYYGFILTEEEAEEFLFNNE